MNEDKMEEQQLCRDIAHHASMLKGYNIKIYDLEGVASYASHAIIISVNSSRQGKSISDKVKFEMKQLGEHPIGVEGFDQAEWILLDFDSVIIHIFTEERRLFYDLERFWDKCNFESYFEDEDGTKSE